MIVTVKTGEYSQAQGEFIQRLPGGLVSISVGGQVIVGEYIPRVRMADMVVEPMSNPGDRDYEC